MVNQYNSFGNYQMGRGAMTQPYMERKNTAAHTNQSSREQLMEKINLASFAMDDTRLFLDTNPDCKEALEYFDKMREIRAEAIKEYEKCYGSIVAYGCGGTGEIWNWNDGNLPWENNCCSGKRG